MITISEVTTAKQRKQFVNFPLKLYKNNPYFVPPLYADEMAVFKKNYMYYDTCEAVYYLAYDENKHVVGRISGILQKASNDKWQQKRVRFTRFDAIDDQEVANALFGAVNHYGNATKITVDGNYNEFGGAKQIVVTNGKVVTESSSVVTSIAAQPADGKKVTVDVSKKVAEVVVETQYEANTTVIGTTAVTESKTIVNALNEAKKYSKDATKVPSGFVIDKTNQTITIKDAVALMYYGYVLDVEKALNADMSTGMDDFKSIWYSNGTYHNVTVKLDADIDLEGAILDKGMNSFGSLFEGDGYTIKNVNIIDNQSSFVSDKRTWRYVGLFAKASGSIANLVLDNISVSTTADGVDNSEAGIVAGDSNKTIQNVVIKNSTVSGGKYTGGVVGYSYGSIVGCTLENVIVSGQSQCGAIVGYSCNSIGLGVSEISNNKITKATVKIENMYEKKVLGKIAGTVNCDPIENTDSLVTLICKNNVFSECTLETDEDFGRVVNGAKVEK